MALRTWLKVLLTAVGAAALAGAGQLGVAYGLGIVHLAHGFLGAAADQWPAQLAWVGWFAMLAAVLGAVAADRMAQRLGQRPTTASRTGAVAFAAGIGAAIVAPLSMYPARAAEIGGSINPVLTVGLTAGVGAFVGVIAAVAVLSQRAIAWSVAAVAGPVWLLGLVAVAPTLGPHDPLPAIRLGVPDLPSLSAGTTRVLALIGIPAFTVLISAAVAGLARWREHNPAAVALCGAGGPALLAFAYLLAGPGDGKAQAAPYWGSIIGLAAGVLGSVVMALAPEPGVAAAKIQRVRLRARDRTPEPSAEAPTVPDSAPAPPKAEPEPEPDDAPTTRLGLDSTVDDPYWPAPHVPAMALPEPRETPDPPIVVPGRAKPASVPKPRPKPPTPEPPAAEREKPSRRGRSRRPAKPEPEPVAPEPKSADAKPEEEAGRKSRFRLRRGERERAPAKPSAASKRDEDYVDWVAGLGKGGSLKPARPGSEDTEHHTG
jgi:hypothetical protein